MKYFSIVLTFFLISGFLAARILKPEGNRRTDKKLRSIYDAAKDGDVDRVKELLDEGINPSIHFTGLNDHYRTLLHVAAEENNIDIIQLLTDRGVPLDITDEYGSTPLHYAAYNGKTAAVKELLRLGANAKAENDDGVTPLDDAGRRSHLGIAKILRDHIVKLMSTTDDSSLGPTGSRHEDSRLNLVYQAAISGDVDKVKESLDNGINPSIHFTGNTENERTLLHLAAEHGHIPIIQLLAEEGVDLDITDGFGSTSLHYAAYNGQTNAVKELLRLGANVNAENRGRTTPLHDAVRQNNPEVVKVLLEHGANVNGTGSNHRYSEIPLVMANRHGYKEIQQLLIDHGATGGYKNIPSKKN